MIYFWAFIKTFGVVVSYFFGLASFILFCTFGVQLIWDNGKLIGICILLLILVGMIIAQFFEFLKAERKKQEKT